MLLSGSVLVVSGAESFQSGNWVTLTVRRQPLICRIASVQKRFAYAAPSLFLAADLLWPHLGYYGSVQSLYSAV